MSDYVRKLRIAVVVGQAGEEPVEGFACLAPRAQFHEGPETLLERLNAADRVVPFERHEDEAIVLLNRLEIEWVLASRTANPDLVRPPTFRITREERVRVKLRGGEELDGVLQMELPEYFNRVSDFLNGPEHFFPLITDQGIILVNKLAVTHTRLYERSPAPVSDDE